MENKKQKEYIREGLRNIAVIISGGCEVQTGYVKGKKSKNGWPCGTCFMAGLELIGLTPKSKEYHEQNEKPDRANEVWRAILQIRDAKLK